MPTLSAAELAAKWKRNLAASIPSYKAGVEAVTVAPTEKAAQAVDRYAAGCMRAAEDGSFVDGCRAVSLDDWKRRALGAGAERIAKGASDGESRVVEFMSQLMPHAQRVKEAIAAMPKGSIEDSIARNAQAIRMMAQFKFRKGRR